MNTPDANLRFSGFCPSMGRRDFLRLAGASSLAMLASPLPVMAGPFEASNLGRLIPEDKKLHPDWVRSLFERGTPRVYRGSELEKIGMPVGGICAGQLYLGGDGKLWHWDIFNQTEGTGDSHYSHPPQPASPIQQGFFVKIGEQSRELSRAGFREVSFRGEYPIGTVTYKDSAVPLEIQLQAFSPFIPLHADDSSLPATILHFTVRNTSDSAMDAILGGQLENAICLRNRFYSANRKIEFHTGTASTQLRCSVEKTADSNAPQRPDLVFEDWHQATYEGWTVEGTAFGNGPIQRAQAPSYQGNLGGDTDRVVNSHATASGSDIATKDSATGRLSSRLFTIERQFINFWIGGGKDQNAVGLRLMVDGQIVQRAAGRDNNEMALSCFDVRSLAGKQAHLEIVDHGTGSWGNVGIGKITFSDRPAGQNPIEEAPDFGTMALTLLGTPAEHIAGAGSVPLNNKSVGELGRQLHLAPGQSATITFVLTWHFPNFELGGLGKVGRHYAANFPTAFAVADYVVSNFERLTAQTRLWRDTWYDSTLPYWLLDRTFLNTSILATSTCFRFKDGRFWAWEGVGCCHGTCTHVWHYAHAMARIFPEIERDTRERVDLGLAMNPETGVMGFRAEFDRHLAIDGQAGTLLRIYREHQMSKDDAFLKRNWPRIRKAFEPLLNLDVKGDGVLEGPQMNTLDTPWYGKIAWLSSLYLAALRAGEQMAAELGEVAFAERSRKIVENGSRNLVEQLFDGDYFINRVDDKRLDCINSGTGCEIDQAIGQSWAFQVGLNRVLPAKETQAALKSLWKYNFAPDVGPYRQAYKSGRWYAMAGEAGLLMCTFPRKGWDFDNARGKGDPGFAGYFNECMNGFEYQAASHMVWEGLVLEGLAVTRAVHDRYDAIRRNPWNEVECGDHYARSMASYGVFTAVSGFEYHGPQGRIGFTPRLTPENFKAAFTTAEGWGSYSQQSSHRKFDAQISIKHGSLPLRQITVTIHEALPPKTVQVINRGKPIASTFTRNGNRIIIALSDPTTIQSTGSDAPNSKPLFQISII